MSVPPRSTAPEDQAPWEVTGERPAPPAKPDRFGLLMVALVLVALLAAVVVLFAV